MTIQELKEVWQALRKNPKKIWPYAIIALLFFVLGSISTGFLSEIGRQWADKPSATKSLKMEMPLDDGMKYTPINLESNVGGKFVGTYASADTVTYATSQSGDASSLIVTPRQKTD